MGIPGKAERLCRLRGEMRSRMRRGERSEDVTPNCSWEFQKYQFVHGRGRPGILISNTIPFVSTANLP